MSRIATVFLGTSLQGSSTIDALLADGTFTPRAVTRNANSPAAKALAARGVQIAEARFDDKEAVRRAVEGAEVVFLVTMPFSDVPEVAQGINVIDASKEAGVKFIVLSSLPSISEFSHGKYTHAVEFDDKDTIRKYLEKSGIPCASIYPGNFMENFPRGVLDCPFEKTESGYILNTREQEGTRCVQVWIKHDMGQAVVALFKNYQTRLPEIEKQAFVLGSVRATIEEVVAEFAKGLGKPVELRRHGKVGDVATDDIYDALREFDVFPGIEIPDPCLKALGVMAGTLEEFARTVLRDYVEKK
ncbi:NAD(P)-binding protein [Schizophyllum commune H4-8]|uniref:NAD(P)-binding protein n=1 Tax=Schizophyllum commune (strain H4-8 / FGSC 9210) TaxID=578458 RepID=UPI00215E111A|nr:NAD(P)-binding protein [Schizophyllum commune H4-8]KAI5897134.1 NAD(P)-binding protein [Schizophyllum commune H4-8]